MSKDTASVSLSLDRWATVRACLLSHALELSREGDHRLALELVDGIVPALRQDGQGRTLDALELTVRERIEA